MSDSDLNEYIFIISGETLPVHVKARDVIAAENEVRAVYPGCKVFKITEEYPSL